MFLCLFVLCLGLAEPALAAPSSYSLDSNASRVNFGYELGGVEGHGTMPITRADLVLDFDVASHSTARVTLNANGVETPTGLVTDALKSEDVLNADAYPEISFVSRSVTSIPGGATIVGDVTLRGVTRPLTLRAEIYRPQGTAPGDLSRLTVKLTGQINRHDFGASGYSGLVDEIVTLDITARLLRND